jgi:hypothetical protein
VTIPLLTPFGPDIWIADGPTVSVIGFHYPKRMAIIRLQDGGLFVWSPVAHSEDLRRELDAIGFVRFIIAPNTLHDLFLKQWLNAYPEAKLYAVPGLQERHRQLIFQADLVDAPAPEWAGQVDQVLMRGNRITTEAVFFHVQSRTVLFTDLIQNFPRGWFKGWRGIIAYLDRLVASEAAVPQIFRVAFSDRKAARVALQRIYAWPAEKVLMAHGVPIVRDGAAFIRRAFRWLT